MGSSAASSRSGSLQKILLKTDTERKGNREGHTAGAVEVRVVVVVMGLPVVVVPGVPP